MSRRSVPRISSTDLCDHADQERVERVWQRLEASLPAADARPPRRVHWVTLAAAATLLAFGGGVFVGKGWSRASVANVAVGPTPDRSETDVLAAGDEARSFPLEGGGRLTLKPGSTVEVQRAGGGVTLKLVQGDATLETPGGGAGPTLVVGDAQLNTQASSTVTVSKRADNVDVGVSRGGARVASPSLNKDLESGENVSVPLHRTSSATSTATPAVAMAPHARHAEVAAPEASVAAAAPAPTSDWQRAYQNGDIKVAAGLLRQQRGSFDSAVNAGSSAQELYEIYDLAANEKEQKAAEHALRRIANEFPDDTNATVAAYQLCAKLPPSEGQKYCEQSKKLQDPENAACRALRAAKHSGNKDKAAQLAQEYVNGHPDGGMCRDEADAILSGEADDPHDAPAHAADAGAGKGDGKPQAPAKP